MDDDDFTPAPRRAPSRPFHWVDMVVLGFDIVAGLTDAINDTALQARNIAAMHANPILIQRPLVETDAGVRLCRPSERVLDILPAVTRFFASASTSAGFCAG